VVDFAFDDAYITFRVARNLAGGAGPVYNTGETVLVSSSPLYMVCMVPGEILGIGAPLWSKLLNTLVSAASAALLYIILVPYVRRGLALFATLFLIASPFANFMILTGMESTVTGFLILLSVYFWTGRRPVALGTVLGLLALVRLEGVFAGLFYLVAVLVRDRREFVRTALPMLLVAGPWYLFAELYYGSFIPNTVRAKGAYFSVNPQPAIQHIRDYWRWLKASLPLAPLGVLAFAAGAVAVFRRSRFLLPVLAWFLMVFSIHVISPIGIAWWYMEMLLPILLLVAVLGAESLISLIPGDGFRNWLNTGTAVLVSGIVLLGSLAGAGLSARNEMLNTRSSWQGNRMLAEWFVSRGVSEERTLCIEAIGIVGYVTDMRILDLFGLASPETIPLIDRMGSRTEDAIAVFSPDFFIEDRDFSHDPRAGYVLAGTLEVPLGSLGRSPGVTSYGTIFIYERADTTAPDP
jgi:hypothetical protein